MYLQLNNILLPSKLTSEEVREPKLLERHTKRGRTHELFQTLKTRTAKKKDEKQIEFTNMIGLKKQM